MEKFVKDLAMSGNLHLPGNTIEIPETAEKFQMWNVLRDYGFQGFQDLELAQNFATKQLSNAPLEERVIRQAPVNLNAPLRNGKFVRSTQTIFERLGCTKRDMITAGFIASDNTSKAVQAMLQKFDSQFKNEIQLSPDLSKVQVTGLEMLSGYRQILLSRAIAMIETLTMERNLLQDKGVVFDAHQQEKHRKELQTWGQIRILMQVLATLHNNWRSQKKHSFEMDAMFLRKLSDFQNEYPLQKAQSYVSNISSRFTMSPPRKQTLKSHWHKRDRDEEQGMSEHARKRSKQNNFH